MQARKLTETYTVAPQILASDVPVIAAEGYRSIMCNRPDGEQPDQPAYAEIAAAAQAAGLVVRHVPVVSGQITPADVEAFRRAIAELPAPVFAYCRSGARCTNLWTMVGAT
jgi:sulfide:quinone oxidoreductase